MIRKQVRRWGIQSEFCDLAKGGILKMEINVDFCAALSEHPVDGRGSGSE